MAALTDPEWDSISLDFPNLVRADTLKTGPVTKDYNCIRFALATPGLWVNPPPQLHDFVEICECLFPRLPRHCGDDCDCSKSKMLDGRSVPILRE